MVLLLFAQDVKESLNMQIDAPIVFSLLSIDGG